MRKALSFILILAIVCSSFAMNFTLAFAADHFVGIELKSDDGSVLQNGGGVIYCQSNGDSDVIRLYALPGYSLKDVECTNPTALSGPEDVGTYGAYDYGKYTVDHTDGNPVTFSAIMQKSFDRPYDVLSLLGGKLWINEKGALSYQLDKQVDFITAYSNDSMWEAVLSAKAFSSVNQLYYNYDCRGDSTYGNGQNAVLTSAAGTNSQTGEPVTVYKVTFADNTSINITLDDEDNVIKVEITDAYCENFSGELIRAKDLIGEYKPLEDNTDRHQALELLQGEWKVNAGCLGAVQFALSKQGEDFIFQESIGGCGGAASYGEDELIVQYSASENLYHIYLTDSDGNLCDYRIEYKNGAVGKCSKYSNNKFAGLTLEPSEGHQVPDAPGIDFSMLGEGDTLQSSGSYYLADNYSLDDEVTVAAGDTLNIDLNGFELELECIENPIIRVLGTLNIYDTAGGGFIRQESEYNLPYQTYIEVDGGTVNFHKGAFIEESKGIENEWYGFLLKNGAVFNLYNGAFAVNSLDRSGDVRRAFICSDISGAENEINVYGARFEENSGVIPIDARNAQLSFKEGSGISFENNAVRTAYGDDYARLDIVVDKPVEVYSGAVVNSDINLMYVDGDNAATIGAVINNYGSLQISGRVLPVSGTLHNMKLTLPEDTFVCTENNNVLYIAKDESPEWNDFVSLLNSGSAGEAHDDYYLTSAAVIDGEAALKITLQNDLVQFGAAPLIGVNTLLDLNGHSIKLNAGTLGTLAEKVKIVDSSDKTALNYGCWDSSEFTDRYVITESLPSADVHYDTIAGGFIEGDGINPVITQGSDTDFSLEGIAVCGGYTGLALCCEYLVSGAGIYGNRGMAVSIGNVSDDSLLYNTSISDNIAYGKSAVSIESSGEEVFIEKCKFEFNTSFERNAIDHFLQKDGTGEYVYRDYNAGDSIAIDSSYIPVTIKNTDFRNNFTGSNGDLSLVCGKVKLIDNCTFTGNTGRGYLIEASVSGYDSIDMLVTDCVFTGNSMNIMRSNSSSIGSTFADCRIENNINLATALSDTTGLFDVYFGTHNIVGCTISGNKAPTVLYSENGKFNLEECIVKNNVLTRALLGVDEDSDNEDSIFRICGDNDISGNECSADILFDGRSVLLVEDGDNISKNWRVRYSGVEEKYYSYYGQIDVSSSGAIEYTIFVDASFIEDCYDEDLEFPLDFTKSLASNTEASFSYGTNNFLMAVSENNEMAFSPVDIPVQFNGDTNELFVEPGIADDGVKYRWIASESGTVEITPDSDRLNGSIEDFVCLVESMGAPFSAEGIYEFVQITREMNGYTGMGTEYSKYDPELDAWVAPAFMEYCAFASIELQPGETVSFESEDIFGNAMLCDLDSLLSGGPDIFDIPDGDSLYTLGPVSNGGKYLLILMPLDDATAFAAPSWKVRNIRITSPEKLADNPVSSEVGSDSTFDLSYIPAKDYMYSCEITYPTVYAIGCDAVAVKPHTAESQVANLVYADFYTDTKENDGVLTATAFTVWNYPLAETYSSFTVEKEGYSFGGWLDEDGIPFDFETVLTENIKLYPSFTTEITGCIDIEDGNSFTDVPVLKFVDLNGTEYSADVVASGAAYRYSVNIPAGLYDAVIEAATANGAMKICVLEDIQLGEYNFTVPAKTRSASVTRAEDATALVPYIIVGGLEDVTQFKISGGELVPAEAEDIVSVVIMASDTPGTFEKDDEKRAIKGRVNDAIRLDDEKIEIKYFDLDLIREVNGASEDSVGDKNTSVLEIVMAADAGMHYPMVLRYHGDNAQSFTRLSSRPSEGAAADGTFYLDELSNKLYIYASKFSTYAVAYGTEELSSQPEPEYISDDETPVCRRGAKCPIDKFIDTLNDFWWHDGIHYCLEKGIMQGVSLTQFAPNDNTRRSEIATVIYRLAKAKGRGFKGEWMFNLDYADAADIQDWAYEAIAWCKVNGIMLGGADGKFEPDRAISRDELVTVFYRFASYMGKNTNVTGNADLSRYADFGQIREFALQAFTWAYDKGIVQGRSADALAPQGTATRAELAAIIQRYEENVR